MITSNLGIYEVPHVSSPAGISDFAKYSKVTKLEELLNIPCVFIPGMKNKCNLSGTDDLVSCINDFDVMRGEEVESFGLLKQFDVKGKGMMVLPGSHTKFVAVGANKELLYCLSTLGGETLQAIQKETILSDSLDSCLIETSIKMLECGYEAAKQHGLTRSFYHVRLIDLFTELDENKRANYFTGSVIYNDLQALSQSMEEVGDINWMIVGGSNPLRKSFTHLLRYMNHKWNIIEAKDQQVEHSLVFGATAGEPRAEDHHALKADVDHPDPLREQATEGREHDRRHGPDGHNERVAHGEVGGAGRMRTIDSRASPPTAKRMGRT